MTNRYNKYDWRVYGISPNYARVQDNNGSTYSNITKDENNNIITI